MAVQDRVMAWGACESGQLGDCFENEELVSAPRHVPPLGSNVSVLSCGPWKTATVADSPNEVFVSQDRTSEATTMQGLESARRVIDVACGEDFMVLLTEDSKILTCGGAAYGQLGRGESVEESTSLRIVKGNVTKRGVFRVVAGSYHWLALTATGEVYGCGNNNRGQLGICGKKSIYEPERIYNLWSQPVVAIAAGESHSAILTAHGALYTLGSNKHGQLGVESTVVTKRIDREPGEASDHGELNSSWSNRHGQRGAEPAPATSNMDGESNEQPSQDWSELPQLVPIPDGLTYVDVACGSEHTVALRSDGRVVAFGRGATGQLGCGSTGGSKIPIVVRLPENEMFVNIAAGGRHSAAINSDGELYTWGAGESGQLGNNDVCDKLYPVKISKPKKLRKRMRDASPMLMDGGRQEMDVNGSEGGKEIADLAWRKVSCGASHTVAVLSPLREKLKTRDLSNTYDIRLDTIIDGTLLFGNPGLLARRYVCLEAGKLKSLDVEKAERDYTNFIERFGDAGSEALSTAACYLGIDGERALERGVDESGRAFSRSSLGMFPEPALVLVLGMINPTLTTVAGLKSMARFAAMARNLRRGGQRAIINALATYFTKDIIVSRLVRPLQMLIDLELRTERMVTETVINSVKTLYLIRCASKSRGARHELVPLKEFYNATITQEVNLTRDYKRRFDSKGENIFSFCSDTYSFILDQEAKSILLREEMKSVQIKFASSSMLDPNCEIHVRRDHIIQDSLDALLCKHGEELRKPLKVQFVGEEGEDAGGLRKEFFQIAIGELFSPDFGMFTYDEENRTHWFRIDSLESIANFHLVGTLIGLAVYNDTILDLRFPSVVYKKLQDLEPDFEDLEAMTPELGRSLRALLDYDGDDVADVFGLNFTVAYDSIYGTREEHELVEGGKDIPVTKDNKAEFVRLYQEWILNSSVNKFFLPFKEGLRNMIPGRMLRLFEPEELEVLVCGERFDDVGQLEKFTRYDGGYTQSSEVIKWFWQALNSLSPEQKRSFLSFVTGTDRVPAGGVEKLNFVIQRSGPDSDRLPTSHTCFNVLLLPEYASFEKTKNRLLLSIENAQGFGLR